jgi:hypothetical protein
LIHSVGCNGNEVDPDMVDYADLSDVGGYAGQLQAMGLWTAETCEALVTVAAEFNSLDAVIVAVGGEAEA